MLTFEIVDFLGAYHAILGQPGYSKFMAIPNYTYLRLKIPGPHEIITIGGGLCQAHLYEWENYDITTAACQIPKPRLIKMTMTKATPEASIKGQPPVVRTECDFSM